MVEDAIHALSVYGHDAVLYTLIAASIVTVVVAVERIIYTTSGRTRSAVARSLSPASVPLEAGTIAQLEKGDGFEGRVIATGLRAGRVGGFKAAEEALAAALAAEEASLRRGLVIIGSVGSNAPFVGLLGTVFGIVKAFADLSLDTTAGSAAVMAGISEALVATGVGLLVAIPAVLLYNFLVSRNNQLMSRLEQLSRVVLMQFAIEGQRASPLSLRREA
ncbi:MAG: MotA/TolQ/ExbB proton channel family protein [Myxococcota bacterium]